MSEIDRHLTQLGIALPKAATPVANYTSFIRVGDLVYVSGQLSNDESGGIKGTVGADVSVSDGKQGARLCGLNLIAQIRAACEGDLDRVVGVVKLGGFVQAATDFTAIPDVINGCSDLFVEVFGDAGRHARSAVGVYRLPLGFAVEVDAILQIR